MGVGYGISRNYPRLANVDIVDIIKVWNRQEISAMSITRLSQRLLMPFALASSVCLGMLLPLSARAQTATAPLPSREPLELNLLRPAPRGGRANTLPARRDVITANTLSPTKLTLPSFWWAKEQFAGKMLSNWIAYPKESRVDFVVNPQLWTLLDYIDRYSFINDFGSVARDYGYNIRVFNQRSALLAAYTCNFSTTPPTCQISFPDSGEGSLRLRSSPAVKPF